MQLILRVLDTRPRMGTADSSHAHQQEIDTNKMKNAKRVESSAREREKHQFTGVTLHGARDLGSNTAPTTNDTDESKCASEVKYSVRYSPSSPS
jgi:hypothetical protein